MFMSLFMKLSGTASVDGNIFVRNCEDTGQLHIIMLCANKQQKRERHDQEHDRLWKSRGD